MSGWVSGIKREREGGEEEGGREEDKEEGEDPLRRLNRLM